jgi:hypothetical protein
MFWQLHHVLNYVRVSFQRSWPESWAESWLFGYWSCEAAREAAHEAVPNRPLGNRIIWQRNGWWVHMRTYMHDYTKVHNSFRSNQWRKSYCSPCLALEESLAMQAARCADSNSQRAADGNSTGGKPGKGRWWSLQVKHTEKVYRRDQATATQARDERHGPTGKRNQGRDEKFDGVLTDVAWPTTSRSIR